MSLLLGLPLQYSMHVNLEIWVWKNAAGQLRGLQPKFSLGTILGPVVQSPIKLMWVNVNFDSSIFTAYP